MATLYGFGESVEPVPVGSISAVFEEVNGGQSNFGVVPVENSTDGRIADTLDMFTRLRVRICGEVPLRIHHSLLGVGPRSSITEVHSKPQALSQCRNWLARHLPSARLVEVASTVTAAQTARERPEVAAIAGVQAAAHYGLDVLAENIEDNASNVTRFFIIGEESAARTGNDKTSIMFEVPHKPGALADAMNIFQEVPSSTSRGSNRSRSHGPRGGYMFFIELDGHEIRRESKTRSSRRLAKRKRSSLEVLGSYPRSRACGITRSTFSPPGASYPDNILYTFNERTNDANAVDCRQLEDESESRAESTSPWPKAVAEGVEAVRHERTRSPCLPRRRLYVDAVRPGAQRDARSIGVTQNLYPEAPGAFTGEIRGGRCSSTSAATYVILGHSERRNLMGETDADVNQEDDCSVWRPELSRLCASASC